MRSSRLGGIEWSGCWFVSIDKIGKIKIRIYDLHDLDTSEIELQIKMPQLVHINILDYDQRPYTYDSII